MATVERRQRRTGGPATYRVRWRDEAGKQRSKSFPKRRLADQWATKVEHDLLSGAYVDPIAGKITLRSYAEEWLSSQTWATSTTEAARSALDGYILPLLGDRPLGSLQPSDVRALNAHLGRELSASTAQVYAGRLHSILAMATTDRVIASNPAAGIRPAAPLAGQVVPPTTTQVELLVAHAPEQHRALLLTLAGLGLRIGEATGLTIDRVDFLGRTVRVDQQAVIVKGQGNVLTARLKTKASYRPLPDVVARALARHIELYGVGEDGVLFQGKEGRPVLRHTARDAMHRAARAGNDSSRARDRRALAPFPVLFHPHDLRHFYASALIESGASVKTVQARLGHASAAVTLDVYGHLWPDNEEQTRAAVDAALSGVDPGSPREGMRHRSPVTTAGSTWVGYSGVSQAVARLPS